MGASDRTPCSEVFSPKKLFLDCLHIYIKRLLNSLKEWNAEEVLRWGKLMARKEMRTKKPPVNCILNTTLKSFKRKSN